MKVKTIEQLRREVGIEFSCLRADIQGMRTKKINKYSKERLQQIWTKLVELENQFDELEC